MTHNIAVHAVFSEYIKVSTHLGHNDRSDSSGQVDDEVIGALYVFVGTYYTYSLVSYQINPLGAFWSVSMYF